MVKIGDIVMVKGRNHNGCLVHPAIVTSMDERYILNVCLIPDGCAPYALKQVPLNDLDTQDMSVLSAYSRIDEEDEEYEDIEDDEEEEETDEEKGKDENSSKS